MNLNEILSLSGKRCSCGRVHNAGIDEVLVGSGVINELPSVISKYASKRVFVLSDKNTYKAARCNVCEILDKSGIAYTSYTFDCDRLMPASTEIRSLLKNLGAPTALSEMGVDSDMLPTFLRATKDIRDKYILSHLVWDLGIVDEVFGGIDKL